MAMVSDEDVAQTSWRLPKDLMKRMKHYAVDNETNLTAIAIEAFEEYLAKHSKK
jgi:predicted DNA-binding protein